MPRVFAGLKGGRSADYKSQVDKIAEAWEVAGLGTDGEVPSSLFATDGKVPDSPNVSIPLALARKLGNLVKQHNLTREKPKDAASRLFAEIDGKNQEQSDMLRLIVERWMEATEWFVRKAHDSGMMDEGIEVSELRNHFTIFERALGAVVNEFFTTLKELDGLLEDTNTTQVDKVVVAIAHPARRRYFFDRLASLRRLGPLRDKGFFDKPPAPVIDDEQGTVRCPPWPESRYLARMAAHDPQTVIGIIASIPDNGNVLVYEDFVDAALSVPPQQAVWVVDRVDAWLNSTFQFQLPAKLGELVSKLADGGQAADAIKLATILLAVLPEDARKAEKQRSALGPEPQLRIDRHDYEGIVSKHVPRLTAAAPEHTLRLFCDLLANATAYSQRVEYRESTEDGSYVWCPSVEHCGPGGHRELLGILTASVRDVAAVWATADGSRVHEIIKLYNSKRWRVFERLGYHLLCCFPDCAMDLVTHRLTDLARFDVFSTRYEYERLAERCFAKLASEAQDKMLSWIDKGPDPAAFADSIEQIPGKRPTPDKLQDYADRWRRDRLAPISHALPTGWNERSAKLIEQYGEASREPFRAVSVGGWDPRRSPITAEELSSKTVEEMVACLDSRRKSDRFHGPSYDDLVDTVTKVVSDEPVRFLESWEAFKPISPRYFYALLQGLREALKKNWQDDWWTGTLAACQWATEQPGALTGEDPDREDQLEPTWTWVTRIILDLLSAGFEASDHAIPCEHREQAWGMLAPVTSHPDPSPADEAREHENSNMDYLTASLNCVRGQAMHAVVRYALWLRRQWEESDDRNELISCGFDAMPEVRDVLEHHLDPMADSSLAVRAVYGQRFPWLCLLDQRWAAERAGTIFAEEDQPDSMWEAAWSSYISYCPAYNDVFQVLRRFYATAIERLPDSKTENDHIRGPAHRLAEHLMSYYGRGVIAVDDDLIDQFFSSAPASIRGRAIEFVGRSLGREEGDVTEEVLERFRILWETRAAAACASDADQTRDPELVAFGSWFASGKFDPAWALAQLRNALMACGRSEPDREVVERLAEVASVDPSVSIECVAYLADGDTQGWAIHSWRESLRAIFGVALGSNNASIIAETRKLINRLGERGFFEFGDLL